MIFNRNKNNSYQAYAQSQPTNKGKLILIVSLLVLTVTLLAITGFSNKDPQSASQNPPFKSYGDATLSLLIPEDFSLTAVGVEKTFSNSDSSESISISKFLASKDGASLLDKAEDLTTKGVSGEVISGLKVERMTFSDQEAFLVTEEVSDKKEESAQEQTQNYYIDIAGDIWLVRFDSSATGYPLFSQSKDIVKSLEVK